MIPNMVTAMNRRPRLVLALGALVLVAASCGGTDDTAAGAGGTSIVVTTSIWGDVVSNVVCDGSADVVVLMNAGADPHSYEPSLSDRADMDAASLVVANGLGLEELLEDTLDAVESDGTPVFRFGDHIDTLAMAEGDEHDDHADEDEHGDHADEDEHGDEDEHADEDEHDDHADEDEHAHDHGGEDPHLWFDPTLTSAALPDLADALVSSAGLNEEAIDECVADYQAELAETDEAILAMLQDIPVEDRLLVTAHDSFGYYAERYDFEVVGSVSPSTSGLAESNPGQLELLAVAAEDRGVQAIFAEAQSSSDEAERLAERLSDIELVILNTGSLGESGGDADTYVTFLETNTQLIVDALG